MIALSSIEKLTDDSHEIVIIKNRQSGIYKLYFDGNQTGEVYSDTMDSDERAYLSFENYSDSLNIDSVEIRLLNSDNLFSVNYKDLKTIIKNSDIVYKEDFKYKNIKDFIENSGWKADIKDNILNHNLKRKRKLLFNNPKDKEYIKIGKTGLLLKNTPDHTIRLSKSIDIPKYYPFDISDNPFKITYNKNMEQAEKGMNKENDNSKQYEDSVINLFPQAPGATPVLNHYNSPPVSYNQNNRRYGAYDSSPETTYYIWSYDGKLLAEYDTNGNCKKDYIYLGSKLIAEYKPQSGTYYYYMQDNTNSVRIITNNAGTVVYSSAYGPYGDSLKTWVNTYDPDLKYSSKQREEWSNIDYFGARYYSNEQFRFTSPDPIKINKERTYKPWLLNLYAYTRNNPMSYVDMMGLDAFIIVYGDAGLGQHNVGKLFEMAAKTRAAEIRKTMKKEDVLILKHISTASGLNTLLSKYNDIKIFEYFGHGSNDTLFIGEENEPDTNYSITNAVVAGGNFVKGGYIRLNSCYSAYGGGSGIAKAFANRYYVPVIGSESAMKFKIGKNGNVKMIGKMERVYPDL